MTQLYNYEGETYRLEEGLTNEEAIEKIKGYVETTDLKEKKDKASKAVETAKDVIDALQEEADLSPDEATKLRKEREEKVINWFKNIFKGE